MTRADARARRRMIAAQARKTIAALHTLDLMANPPYTVAMREHMALSSSLQSAIANISHWLKVRVPK